MVYFVEMIICFTDGQLSIRLPVANRSPKVIMAIIGLSCLSPQQVRIIFIASRCIFGLFISGEPEKERVVFRVIRTPTRSIKVDKPGLENRREGVRIIGVSEVGCVT